MIVLGNPAMARARHSGRPLARAGVRQGAAQAATTVEGKVVEVRRASRDLTVRTAQGEQQHVRVLPPAAGAQGLDGIRAGMRIRVVGRRDPTGVLAREIVVHPDRRGRAVVR
jgi:hypothetical protein